MCSPDCAQLRCLPAAAPFPNRQMTLPCPQWGRYFWRAQGADQRTGKGTAAAAPPGDWLCFPVRCADPHDDCRPPADPQGNAYCCGRRGQPGAAGTGGRQARHPPVSAHHIYELCKPFRRITGQRGTRWPFFRTHAGAEPLSALTANCLYTGVGVGSLRRPVWYGV